jgi:hypothetical protein
VVVAGAVVAAVGVAAGDLAEVVGALVDLAADRAAEAGHPAVGEMFFSDFA